MFRASSLTLIHDRLKSPMKRFKKITLFFFALFVIGFLLPERVRIPVAGATTNDWNHNTYWFEPWGDSGVHKGVDIFGKKGAVVTSATDGIVIYTGRISTGGNVIVILGAKWRFHYYAHLNSIDTSMVRYVDAGEPIATLGNSGNAQNKPPHLHYSIVRLFPAPWAIDSATQGYKKAFYIDPDAYLKSVGS